MLSGGYGVLLHCDVFEVKHALSFRRLDRRWRDRVEAGGGAGEEAGGCPCEDVAFYGVRVAKHGQASGDTDVEVAFFEWEMSRRPRPDLPHLDWAWLTDGVRRVAPGGHGQHPTLAQVAETIALSHRLAHSSHPGPRSEGVTAFEPDDDD
jgi:hypothetical protein